MEFDKFFNFCLEDCDYDYQDGNRDEDRDKDRDREQTHVHEFLGLTKIVRGGEDAHNHRFASVTCEVIRMLCASYPKLFENSDFYEEHRHKPVDRTGIEVIVNGNRHVYFAEGENTRDDSHDHAYQFATLIKIQLATNTVPFL